jgi:hypothetical protein
MSVCLVLPSSISRPKLHNRIARILSKQVLPPSQKLTLLHLLVAVLLLQLLLLCANIESNPGPAPPPKAADLCLLCDKTGRRNQIKINCDTCDKMFHAKCLKLSRNEVTYYRDHKYVCWKCALPSYSKSFFDSSVASDTCHLNASYKKDRETGISILSFNSRSMKDQKKKPVLMSWLHTMNASIVCVSETWLNENIKSSELFDLAEYVVFRKDRVTSRGSGVHFAVKSYMRPKRLTHLENNSESVYCDIM